MHVKTRTARECRALLSVGRLVVGDISKVQNHLRGTLKAFGLKTGKTSLRRLELRIRELVSGNVALVEVADELLQIRRVLLDRLEAYDRKVLEIVRADAVCRRLMTAPGVGPIIALSYRTAMDSPAQKARVPPSLQCPGSGGCRGLSADRGRAGQPLRQRPQRVGGGHRGDRGRTGPARDGAGRQRLHSEFARPVSSKISKGQGV